MKIESISYLFDSVRFNVYFDRNHLLSIPELRELNRKHLVAVFDAFDAAKERGYNSRIEVTAPTNNTLDIIEKAIHDCYMSVDKFKSGKSVDSFISISMVEIARDFIVDTESDANLLADRLMSMTGKKYTASFIIYDAENNPKLKERKAKQRLKEDIFSTRTGYWGSKNNFQYVVYGRYSKLNRLPAAHTEWRISGASNIRKRTGIKSIKDMRDFDFKKFFEEHDKFLVFEDIDYTAIGRWVKGIDGRRTLTKRQKMSVDVMGQHFCSGQRINVKCKDNCSGNNCWSLACEIHSAAALKQYLTQNEGKIKNRKGEILGNEKYRFFIKKPITIESLFKVAYLISCYN